MFLKERSERGIRIANRLEGRMFTDNSIQVIRSMPSNEYFFGVEYTAELRRASSKKVNVSLVICEQTIGLNSRASKS